MSNGRGTMGGMAGLMHKPVAYHRNGEATWHLWCDVCDWRAKVRYPFRKRLLRRLQHDDRPPLVDELFNAHMWKRA